jgi:hypothetical protein
MIIIGGEKVVEESRSKGYSEAENSTSECCAFSKINFRLTYTAV